MTVYLIIGLVVVAAAFIVVVDEIKTRVRRDEIARNSPEARRARARQRANDWYENEQRHWWQ